MKSKSVSKVKMTIDAAEDLVRLTKLFKEGEWWKIHDYYSNIELEVTK